MKIGNEVRIRYKECQILQYYPEYNAFRAAQILMTGGYNKYTEFLFPAGIFNIQAEYTFPDLSKRKLVENNGLFADEWKDEKGYYIYMTDQYEQTGLYYLYELHEGACLKHSPIREAVNFSKEPIIKYVNRAYKEDQKGYNLVNEIFQGEQIKGTILDLYSKSKGMKPLHHIELTSEILANRFAETYALLVVNDHWMTIKVNALKF